MNLLQKAKLLFSLNKAWREASDIVHTQPHKPMKLKSGVKSSEFWITLTLGLGSVVMGALGQIEGTWATAAATILGAIYTAGRSLAKSKSEE